VALARPRCLYCGAPFDQALVDEVGRSAAAALAAPPAAGPARTLVVIDLEAATPAALSDGLGLGAFEARQRKKRGGYALEMILEHAEAEAESQRLAAAGLLVVLVPEAEAKTPCWLAGAGSWDGVLHLQGDGRREIAAGGLLLVVKGPIAREYQVPEKKRRVETARLEPGYRFHLHLRDQPVPVEIDPFDLSFPGGPPLSGSSQIEVQTWLDALRAGAPEDDAFRHVTPALGLRKDDGMRALPGMPPGARAGAPLAVLDNLAQFRFYSAWRAAVERRAAR
jgi:hypothetical protein